MFVKLPWPRRLSPPLIPPSHAQRRHLYIVPLEKTIFMKLTDAMAACKNLRSLRGARTVHARMVTLGLNSIVFLQNHLLALYAHCDSIFDCKRVYRSIEFPNVFTWNGLITGLSNSGHLGDARKMFDEMPVRDVVSWNAMMTAYFRHGVYSECLGVFGLMMREAWWGVEPMSFSCAMKACGGLKDGGVAVQLHGLMVKFDFVGDSYVDAAVLDMYVKCGDVDSAWRLFERMASPSLFCWNSVMFGCAKVWGIDEVVELFQRMPEKDLVSWNTLISSFSQRGCVDKTLLALVEMRERGFEPNAMSYSSALSACSSVFDLNCGKQLHTQIIRFGLVVDVFVGSALIDLYAKCGSLRTAQKIFDLLPTRNAVSWTTLIAGLAQAGNEEEAFELIAQMKKSFVAPDNFTLATLLSACSTKQSEICGMQLHAYTIKAGDVHQARFIFNQLPERNKVTWSSMLGAYVHNGFLEEGLKMYVMMLKAVQTDLNLDVSGANAIITMYCKCRRVEDARQFFHYVLCCQRWHLQAELHADDCI